jgi:hypothetical protein
MIESSKLNEKLLDTTQNRMLLCVNVSPKKIHKKDKHLILIRLC